MVSNVKRRDHRRVLLVKYDDLSGSRADRPAPQTKGTGLVEW